VLTALTKTIIIIISHIFISDVFSKGKKPLTLILILVLTFNKRCAKTKTKNDYIDIKIRSQIGLCSWPINTLHNNIWTATFFLKSHRHNSQVTSQLVYCCQLQKAYIPEELLLRV
jgi:hypothetical protein